MLRKKVRNLVKKVEKTGCTCDRPRSGRPHVPVEVITEVHNKMTTGSLHAATSVFCNLYVPKISVFEILCSILRMFLYRFQCGIWRHQQRVDFENFFLIRCDKDNRCPDGRMSYGRMRHILPLLETLTPRTAIIGWKKILTVWHQCDTIDP